MKKNAISPDQEYTFRDYFRLRASTEDVLAYFGYAKQNARLELPRSNRETASLANLYAQLEDIIFNIGLENEITRREFLIAPVMAEVRRIAGAKLSSEYWFEFNHQLKGSLDYFLRKEFTSS